MFYDFFFLGYGLPQITAPSSFAEYWSKCQKEFHKNGELLLCHIPTDLKPHGCDVTLFYKGFDDFVRNSEEVQLDDCDYQTALKLCQLMGMQYKTEEIRADVVTSILQDYMNFMGLTFQNQVRRMDISLVVSSHPVAIIEMKNGVGQGKVDSYMEVIK